MNNKLIDEDFEDTDDLEFSAGESSPCFDPAAFAADHGIPVRDLERYPLDGCERTRRGGSTDYPYAGCSVWLLPDTPLALTTAALDFRMIQQDDGAGRVGFAKLATGLSQVVAGHDIPGLPQFYGDPAAVEQATAPLLFYIFRIAMSGEVPEDRPNGSAPGQTGSSTRRSSGLMTGPSRIARPRRVSGSRT